MPSRTFAARLAALEQLERTHQLRELPAFVCVHTLDWEAYTDVTTPRALVDAIADAYDLSTGAKVYVNACLCWGVGSCRVCDDAPFIGETRYDLTT